MSRERAADRCIADLDQQLRRYPGKQSDGESWRTRFLRTLEAMAKDCLGFPEAGLKLFFNRTALEATRQFIRQAKEFDPTLSDDSLYQALRNLWVIHNLQLFLASPDAERSGAHWNHEPRGFPLTHPSGTLSPTGGEGRSEGARSLGSPLVLTPAGFAYSMLYPWTDNYLDDPQIPERSKADFGDWLGRRLAGLDVPPPDLHAAQVDRLVTCIEDTFDRADYPAVYLSLRAIHAAQLASLQQQDVADAAAHERLLTITFRKGGTSVLTDAYLVRGWLSEAEGEFMFGYGGLLQLMDDLQDLRYDRGNRHATLFTRQAEAGPLDEITSRLWSFSREVLGSSERFAAPRFEPLKTLIQDNCKLMLLQSVALNRSLYTAAFAEELEVQSPFRFSYLRRRHQTLRADNAKIAAFLQRQHGIDSVLAALG